MIGKRENNKPMSRLGKTLLALFIWGFSAYILVLLAGGISANISAKNAKEVWRNWQIDYVNYLENQYNTDANFSKVQESDFLTGCTYDELMNAKLNQVRYLASHNSYKTGLTPETKYLYHGPLAIAMNNQYDYIYDTITEQLNMGIRSIELDPNKVKTDDGFTIDCVHSDVFETNSTFVNFELGLKEIKMWLDRNTECAPIIVLLEPKGGKNFDLEAFDMLDNMIINTFGEKLVKPSDLLGTYKDFDAFRKADAYPTISELKGKIMFLLHEKDSMQTYMERDPDMKNCAMSIALERKTAKDKHPEYTKFAFTLIDNNPTKDFEHITNAVTPDGGNFMVRTRLDKYAVVKAKNHQNGLDSNANILSTDYIPHVNEHIYPYPISDRWEDTYLAKLYEFGKTITLRK